MLMIVLAASYPVGTACGTLEVSVVYSEVALSSALIIHC